MRIFHLSDLHIGKHLHFYNLAQDQNFILNRIVELAQEYAPDAIVIAGDIYDKSVPSGESYEIFDNFLNKLAKLEPAIPVMIIAGNHDSAERLNYASSFLEQHHIYIAVNPPMEKDEKLKKITLKDQWGDVDFYLFPFTKPGYVRHMFEEDIPDYETAFSKILERENIDYKNKRNVLVAHQFFVSGGKQPDICDSENMNLNVGGLDAIDTSVISEFDYVALGHIHGPQNLSGGKIRYCGTPLKYSVSEEKHNKSISLITIEEKGKEPTVETIPLVSLRDVRKLKGTMEELLGNGEKYQDDYVSIVLTDEDELYRPKDVLEEKYKHILEVTVDNNRTRKLESGLYEQDGEYVALPSPAEAFGEFYQMMNGQPMSDKECEILAEIIEQI